MPRQVDWQLAGSDDQPIYGTAHLPDNDAVGVLLIAHGFKGYKDYGLFPYLARAAAEQGLIAHRFNFSHSGMTRNVDTFERPELFERDTFSRQVEDLWTVAAAADAGEIAGASADRTLPQVWFGHSRGGVTALCASGQLAAQGGAELALAVPMPVGVVSAAAPDRANHLQPEQDAMLRRAGKVASPSGRTGQLLMVGRDWLTDIETQGEALDPQAMAGQGNWPVLIVHGSADEIVPVESAQSLTSAAGERGQLEIIQDASHTFNSPNPLPLDETPPAAAKRLVALTCEFAVRCCKRSARP
ncbi:alpha/beta hydrolase [Phycisphaerales bacterium AB-hyl4]|uniref:Alpha/beta hydrolase n=1 Tax=Natronomicrosphaera hydrolytica TaxID=3242702 RepID=A0ABV4U2I4_9BACT